MTIYSEGSYYGVIIICAISIGLLVSYFIAKQYKYTNNLIIALLIYIFVGSIIGAKYFSFLANYEQYDGIFNFVKVGMSSYGAVIGIIIMIIVFSFQYHKKINELFHIITIPIPLMYSIGKIACFISGCCYGIKYSGLGNVIYKYSHSAPINVSLFPVQIFETIAFMLIFLLLFYLEKKRYLYKYIIGLAFIINGIAKFSLDYLRNSHVGVILSINQLFSIIFVIAGIVIICVQNYQSIKNNN